MIKKIVQKIRANSSNRILLCGGIIVLVILLGILPLYRYNSNRTKTVQKLQDQIHEQKELAQVYQILRKATEKKEIHALPNPVKTKLLRQDADKFQDSFRVEAVKSGMTTVSLMPDLKTIVGGSQSLLYNATVKGEFANFRRLLIGLGGLPYIDQIDEVNMRQNNDSLEFELKIWIALAN